MALIPNNQIEAILSGEEVVPTSREQVFLEQSVRANLSHLRVTFTITTVGVETRVSANKSPDDIKAAVQAGCIVDGVDNRGNCLVLSATDPTVTFYQVAFPATFKVISDGESWAYWDVA